LATASPYLRDAPLKGRPDPGGRYTWVLVAAGLLAFAVAGGVSLAVGELQALYVTMSVALCLAVFADFRIGAVAMLLMLPIQSTELFPHELMGITGLNPANLVLAATLASYLVRGRQNLAGRLVPAPLLWLCLAPIAVAGLIGAPHAADIVPVFSERELIHFTGPVGYLRDMLVRPLLLVPIALLIGAAAARSEKPERFLIPLAISVWLIAAMLIGYVISTGASLSTLSRASERAFFQPLGLHANGVGRLLAAAYALLLFPWWETKRAGLKLFLFATMGVLAVALLLTFSRGAFTGFIVVNLLFLAWKFNLRSVGLAALALVVAMLFMPGP
jgi:hypothetical protein